MYNGTVTKTNEVVHITPDVWVGLLVYRTKHSFLGLLTFN